MALSSRPKFKILIATGIWPPDIGGPATYAYNLSRELQGIGCDIKILTYSDEIGGNIPISNIQINKIARKQNILLRYFKYFWAVRRLAKEIDIVYALDLMSAGLPAVLAAKLRGRPIFLRTGGDFLWEKAFQSGWTELPLDQYYEIAKSGKEKILLQFCRLILKGFNAVIFSSLWQARLYEKYYGLPAAKTKFIDNPMPMVVGNNSAVIANKNIIFAGRLIKLKNLPRLIRAFGKLPDNNVRLQICGEGPEKEKLRILIADLKLAGRVFIDNRLGQDELHQEIRSALFVVIPSLSEISPNLALECLSLNKPVILTRANGLAPEIAAQTISIDPQDEDDLVKKMAYLIDPVNRDREIARLTSWRKPENSWTTVANEHLAIFNEFI